MEEPKYKSSYEGIQVDNAVSGFVNTIGNSSLEDHKNDYRTVLDRKESTIAENKLLTLGRDGFLVDSGLSKGEVVTRDELDATVNLSAISQTGNTALYPIIMKKVPTHPDATPSGYTVDGEGLEYPRMFGWLTEEANNKYREHLYAVISNNDPVNKVFVNTVYEVYPDDDKVFSNGKEIPSDGDGIASGFHPVSLLPVTSEGVSTETNPSFVVTYRVSLDVDRQEIRLRWYNGDSWKNHVSITRKASLSVPFGVYTQSDKLVHVFYADDGGMEVQNVDPVGGNVIGGPSVLLDRSTQLDDNGNAVMDSTMDSPVLVQIGASTYMLVYQTNVSKGLGYPLEVRYAYVRYDGSAHEFHVLQNPATLFRIKGKMVNSPYVSRTGSGRLVFSFHSDMDYVGGDGYGNGAIHREGFYVYTTLKKVYGGTTLRQSDLMPLYSPVTDAPNGWSGGYGSTFSMGYKQYFLFITGTNPKLDISTSEMVRLGIVDYEKDMEDIYEYIDRAITENGNLPIPPQRSGQYVLTTTVDNSGFVHSWKDSVSVDVMTANRMVVNNGLNASSVSTTQEFTMPGTLVVDPSHIEAKYQGNTPANHEYLKYTIGSNDIITIKKQEGTMVSLFNLDNLTVGSNKVVIDIQDRDGDWDQYNQKDIMTLRTNSGSYPAANFKITATKGGHGAPDQLQSFTLTTDKPLHLNDKQIAIDPNGSTNNSKTLEVYVKEIVKSNVNKPGFYDIGFAIDKMLDRNGATINSNTIYQEVRLYISDVEIKEKTGYIGNETQSNYISIYDVNKANTNIRYINFLLGVPLVGLSFNCRQVASSTTHTFNVTLYGVITSYHIDTDKTKSYIVVKLYNSLNTGDWSVTEVQAGQRAEHLYKTAFVVV